MWISWNLSLQILSRWEEFMSKVKPNKGEVSDFVFAEILLWMVFSGFLLHVKDVWHWTKCLYSVHMSCMSWTCQWHMFVVMMCSNFQKYNSRTQEGDCPMVAAEFPFVKFFENAPQPLFRCRTYAEDMDIAEGCFRHIRKIFQQLEVGRC